MRSIHLHITLVMLMLFGGRVAAASDPDNPLNLTDDCIAKLFNTGKAMAFTAGLLKRSSTWDHDLGNSPERLSLIQQHLGSPGDDPFGNGPLRLEGSAGKIRIYSVGPDGRWDDGKLWRSNDPKLAGDIAAEIDLTEPVPHRLKILNDELVAQYLVGERTAHILARHRPRSAKPPPASVNWNFGPLVDGLRAAVELITTNGQVNAGESVGVRFHIQNEADYDIQIRAPLPRNGIDSLFVTDEIGRPVITSNSPASLEERPELVQRMLIKPGEEALFTNASLIFATSKTQMGEASATGNSSALVVPGNYAVRYDLYFPGACIVRATRLGAMDPGFVDSLPQPGDWQGALQTGLLVVKVVESVRSPKLKPPETVLGELRTLLPEDWTCELTKTPGPMEAAPRQVSQPLFRLDFTNANINYDSLHGGGSGSDRRPASPCLRLYFLPAAEAKRFQQGDLSVWNRPAILIGETPDYAVLTSLVDINGGKTSVIMERAIAPLGRVLESYLGRFASGQVAIMLGMRADAFGGVATAAGFGGQVVDAQTGKPIKEFRVEWSVSAPEDPGGALVPLPNINSTYFGGRFAIQFDRLESGWNWVDFCGQGSGFRYPTGWVEGQKVRLQIRAKGYRLEPVTPQPVVFPAKITNLVVRLRPARATQRSIVEPGSRTPLDTKK
jgi:hypothetical protein